MKRQLAIFGILLLLAGVPAWAERPAWCKDGYVCLETEVALQRERKIIQLELDLADARLTRVKRLGFTVGPTLVYSSAATDTFIPIVPGFGITWGFRF